MARYTTYESDGTTYYQFQAYLGTNELTGKPVRVTRRKSKETGLPFKTQAQAEREVKRLENDFRSGAIGGKRSTQTPFKEVFNKWMREYKKSVRPSTLAHTERRFRQRILPSLDGVLVERVDRHHLRDVAERWADENPKDYKALFNFTKRVFDYAVYLDIIKDNPMHAVRLPQVRVPKVKETAFYEPDELMDFLELAHTHGGDVNGRKWGMFFHLLAFTGCRKGEALALKWQDIDLDRRTVSFNKTLSKVSKTDGKNEVIVNDTTKNGGVRTIALDEWTVEKLTEWKDRSKGQLVFPAEHNTRSYMHPDLVTTTMRRINVKMRKRGHKKNVTPHGLRHTHCSILFAAGRPVKEVQYRLGHKSSRVTLDIYTHVTQGKAVETADAFLEYVEGNKKKTLLSQRTT